LIQQRGDGEIGAEFAVFPVDGYPHSIFFSSNFRVAVRPEALS
jgi:hypothetical protein